jgi:hypothetical protein
MHHVQSMQYDRRLSYEPLSRAAYIASHPTLADAATFIGIDPSGVSRAVKRLGIEPFAWGNRDKRLAIADVLRLAIYAKRATPEEVADRLLAWTDRYHLSMVGTFKADIDAFFAAAPEAQPRSDETFIAELRAALPEPWAERAESIYRAHVASIR